MSFNGSGIWTANSAGQPCVTGTVISSTVFNAFTSDVATGLSNCVTKDGQSTASALVPFAQGISVTGVALNAFVDAETPSGTINGVGSTGNAVFTLAHAPSPAASLIVLHKDGTPYIAFGKDYNLAGLTITFVAASTPQTGDLLYASYRY